MLKLINIHLFYTFLDKCTMNTENLRHYEIFLCIGLVMKFLQVLYHTIFVRWRLLVIPEEKS